MVLSRFRLYSIISVLSLACACVFAMAAPAVAYVVDCFKSDPVGLDHAALRSATETVSPALARERVRSFGERRESRIVGIPSVAFALAVPRQSGLIAA